MLSLLSHRGNECHGHDAQLFARTRTEAALACTCLSFHNKCLDILHHSRWQPASTHKGVTGGASSDRRLSSTGLRNHTNDEVTAQHSTSTTRTTPNISLVYCILLCKPSSRDFTSDGWCWQPGANMAFFRHITRQALQFAKAASVCCRLHFRIRKKSYNLRR